MFLSSMQDNDKLIKIVNLTLFLFLPDQSGENKNKHFTCEKFKKNADEMRFINCWSVVL